MTTQNRWADILLRAGFAAMLLGAIDPMEGSLVILPGSGLVMLGTFLGHGERKHRVYRLWVFGLITAGVAALFWLSMLGGFGPPERSIWWGVLVLPYLVGWVMGIVGADSPRWVLWLGIAVGCWYVAIPTIMERLLSEPQPEAAPAIQIVHLVIGLTGLATIGGSIYRLRTTSAAARN